MLRIIEIVAVVLSLMYTWLYLHGNQYCFFFGATGSALFAFLCFRKKIYAESALQLFYIASAIYGFLHFSDEWTTSHWSLVQQLPWIISGLIAVAVTAIFLKSQTDAKLPWVDSTITVFSIIATWMMVNFVHENWLYWMVIDTAGIFIYLHRRLFYGALLFLLYLLMSIDGYFILGWF